MEVTRAMGWRRGDAGYGAGCTQAHVDNRIPATMGKEYISGIGPDPLELNATYIVTNIEDSPLVDLSKLLRIIHNKY